MEEGSRPARPEDIPRIVELAREGIAELSVTKGGAVWARREARAEPIGASLVAVLDDPAAAMVVGTIDDTVVGYGVVRAEMLRDGALLGVVDDLYVEEGCRAVWVGEVIMDDLLAWCRTQGCMGVDSLALPGNRATKNFFERFGLVARAIVVHKSLIEPEASP
ncbi:hypothetical protein BH24ACT3_BH24ACT3_08450 [soil metagenome]